MENEKNQRSGKRKPINTGSAKLIVDDLAVKEQVLFIQEKTGENIRQIISRLVAAEFEKVGGKF